METKIITITAKLPVEVPVTRAAPRKPKSRRRTRAEIAAESAVISLSYIVVGAAAGTIVGAWAIPYAAAERGYRGGIGGEWLLIIAVIAAACWLQSRVIRLGGRK